MQLPSSRAIATPLLIVFAIAHGILSLSAPQVAAAGVITGQVFQDYNGDGIQNLVASASLPAVDSGLGAITITAYDAGGAAIATTTSSSSSATLGQYTLSSAALSALPAGTPLRIEFSSLPSGYRSGIWSTTSATSVQFVTTSAAGLANVNFAALRPSQYCQNNPRLATSCFASGDPATPLVSNARAVVSYPYDATTPGATTAIESRVQHIGAIWGMAYQRASQSLFVAAYAKRKAGFGPGTGQPTSDGTGTIYRVITDLASPGSSPNGVPFVDIDDLFGAATTGADQHVDYVNDPNTYAAVGKSALGDIDIDEDDQTLWVINLADRQLYRLPIGIVPTAPSAAAVSVFNVPDPGCVNGVARPFAVTPELGSIYVGGVCTAELIGGTAADLRAYVYRLDPAGPTWTLVLSEPLNYPRGCSDIDPGYPALPVACRGAIVNALDASWRPWRDTLDTTFPAGNGAGFTSHPQPMLTDIEFLDGDMLLAFRDRFADQIGQADAGPSGVPPGGNNLFAIPAGDLLRASQGGIGWQFESNGQSNPPGAFTSSAGQNNEQGPGNGEFYAADDLTGGHDELLLGGIAQLAGAPEVSLTAFDPIAIFTAGSIQLSNTTGNRVRSFQIIDAADPVAYGKANALGDIEVLCNAAPIEVGNRVWYDADRNGIQDPDEPPIAGVEVELFNPATNSVIAVATTDSAGGYYFSSGPGSSTASARYNLALAFGTSYQVRIALNQPELTVPGYIVTVANTGGGSIPDQNDSDGLVVGAYDQVSFATGGAGDNNHTYDFGFSLSPTAIALTRLSAVWQDHRLHVVWETAAETESYGFLIYRSASGQWSDAALATPQIIYATGNGGGGSQYAWIDPSAIPDAPFSYWLVEVDRNGVTSRYGPTSAQNRTAGSADFTAFLPTVER
jgi:SdrD B-like domain